MTRVCGSVCCLEFIFSAPPVSWEHGNHLFPPEDWSCRVWTFRCDELSYVTSLSLNCCHVKTPVLTLKCVCIRAVPGGEDPQRGSGSGPNIGFCLEQRSNQAQRSSSRWTHPAGFVILRKQVQTHTHTHTSTHTQTFSLCYKHACMSLCLTGGVTWLQRSAIHR